MHRQGHSRVGGDPLDAAFVSCAHSSGAGNVPELLCQQAQGCWTEVASALLPKHNTVPPKNGFPV